MRVSKEELAASSVTSQTISPIIPVRGGVPNVIVYIDRKGQELPIGSDVDKYGVAKKVVRDSVAKYYVLVNMYDEPFRPDDKVYEQESNRRAKNSISESVFRLVECNEKTYLQYCRYLRNRNMASYPKKITL